MSSEYPCTILLFLFLLSLLLPTSRKPCLQCRLYVCEQCYKKIPARVQWSLVEMYSMAQEKPLNYGADPSHELMLLSFSSSWKRLFSVAGLAMPINCNTVPQIPKRSQGGVLSSQSAFLLLLLCTKNRLQYKRQPPNVWWQLRKNAGIPFNVEKIQCTVGVTWVATAWKWWDQDPRPVSVIVEWSKGQTKRTSKKTCNNYTLIVIVDIVTIYWNTISQNARQ